MGAMNTSQYNRTSIDISKNIQIMAVAEIKAYPKQYPAIIDKENVDLKINKKMGYEGIGAAPVKPEGGDADQSRIYEGYTETAQQASYVYELPVTWEQRRFAVKDAKFMNQLGSYLARSGLLRYEYSSANVLNNGFTASSYQGGDGKAYYAADHIFKSGGTYDNLLTAADLSYTSLKAAIIEVASAKMEKSIPANLQIKQITVGPSYTLTLPELLKSTMDPDTANNTYNAVTEIGIKKNLNHYIGSNEDAWYVDSQIMTRFLQEGSKPRIDDYTEDKPNNLVERLWTSIGTIFFNQLASFGNAGA